MTEPKFKYSYEECLACVYMSNLSESKDAIEFRCFKRFVSKAYKTEKAKYDCPYFKSKKEEQKMTENKRDWLAELAVPGKAVGLAYKWRNGKKAVCYGDRRLIYPKASYPVLCATDDDFSSMNSIEGLVYSTCESQRDIIDAWEEPVVPVKVKVNRVKVFYKDFEDNIVESNWHKSAEQFKNTYSNLADRIVKEEWREFLEIEGEK